MVLAHHVNRTSGKLRESLTTTMGIKKNTNKMKSNQLIFTAIGMASGHFTISFFALKKIACISLQIVRHQI